MKTLKYDGLNFVRDDKTGYYLCSKVINGERPRLHRYKWEKHHGFIPKGHHIHHKDHDKDNNEIDNLILLEGRAHVSHHNKYLSKEFLKEFQAKGQEEAKKWHVSEGGRRWHKQHFEKTLQSYASDFTEEAECVQCGAEFLTTKSLKGRARFCSNKCKSGWRRESGIDDEARKCVACGNEFTANKYSARKKCNRSCKG